MAQKVVEWFKSPFSYANGNCVEVRFPAGGGAEVRNSRNPGGSVLRFTAPEWDAFIAGVKNKEFDQ